MAFADIFHREDREGFDTMIKWNGFRRFMGFGLVAFLPAMLQAGTFDGFVDPEGIQSGSDLLATDDGLVAVDSTTVEQVGGDWPAAEDPDLGTAPIWAGADAQVKPMASSRLMNRLFTDVESRWFGQVDLLMLWQNNLQSRALFIDDISGRTALDADQAQTPLVLGPRVGMGVNLNANHALEGNYFQAGFFEGGAVTPPGQYTEANLAGKSFGPIDQAGFATQAIIQSAEMNWRCRRGQPISLLAGFRWVQWNQDMAILEVNGGVPDAAYVVQTGNDLYGGQLGLDACLWNEPQGRVKINAVGKAGVYYNNAFQRIGFIDPNGPVELAATAGETSFFGELTATVSVALTKHLAWRAGYSLFWLGGVATPAQQLSGSNVDVTNPPTRAAVDANGSVLVNGATTGLEARW